MKRAEKTELTVSKIMKAALIEFGANGYAGGTINNICKSGISKGLIYYNFQDKDDLYLACLKVSCGKLIALIHESGRTPDPLQYMNRGQGLTKARIPEEPSLFRGFSLQGFSS